MSRSCDICGASISTGAGVCPGCGMQYHQEGAADEVLYDKPSWGAIKLNISEATLEQRSIYAAHLKKIWAEIEVDTAQILFPDQSRSINIAADEWTLYGPYSSYLSVQNDLLLSHLSSFSPLDIDEIYKIRESHCH